MTDETRYYILIGKNGLTGKYELIFGDHDREVVEDEREDTSGYKHLRIRRVSPSADHLALVATLNS